MIPKGSAIGRLAKSTAPAKAMEAEAIRSEEDAQKVLIFTRSLRGLPIGQFGMLYWADFY